MAGGKKTEMNLFIQRIENSIEKLSINAGADRCGTHSAHCHCMSRDFIKNTK